MKFVYDHKHSGFFGRELEPGNLPRLYVHILRALERLDCNLVLVYQANVVDCYGNT